MKNPYAFTLLLGISLLSGAGCQSNKETLLMGDFFTGNLVSYKNGKMEIIASGFRGADAIEQDGDMLYVSSWPLGKVSVSYTHLPSPRDGLLSRMPSSA